MQDTHSRERTVHLIEVQAIAYDEVVRAIEALVVRGNRHLHNFDEEAGALLLKCHVLS